MTRPKLNLQLPITTAAIAFLAGIALVMAQPNAPKTATVHMSADTTPSTTSTAPTSTAPAPGTDVTTMATSPSVDTTAPSSGSSSVSPSTGSTVPTTSDTSTGTSSPAQSVPTPAVTATSAVPGDWSAPVPSPGGAPHTEQDQYCTYTYSDSTTQTELLATKSTYADGVVVEAVVAGACSVADAPAGV